MVHSRGVSSASATAVERPIAPSDDTGARVSQLQWAVTGYINNNHLKAGISC
jgi:hypothetical protein